jgi:Mg-chelatase subunit ChlD
MSHMARVRLLLASLLAFAAVLGGGSSIAARTADADVPVASSLQDLVDTYDTGEVPADLVVVVDTSGSMASDGNPPPWPSVQDAWKSLAETVGPNDRVALITFNTVPARRWDFKPVETPEQRAELIAALPGDAPQGGTDIGLALQAAVDALEQGGSSDIQRVVFITDGLHQPPGDPTFPTDTDQGDWPKLVARGNALVDSRGGRLTAFGWAPPGSGATDVDLVQKVFPQATILALPNDQFPNFMAGLATDVQRERVRPAVTADLETQITSTFTLNSPLSADMAATLTFTNPREGLPTNVDLTGVTVTDADGEVVPASVAPSHFTLTPGQSTELPVGLQPPGTDHGFALGERLDAREWQVAVAATTALTPELTDLLRREQLAQPQDTVGSVAQPEKVSISAPYGLAWWKFITFVVLFVAAIIVLELLRRWLFVPPALSGRIVDVDGQLLLELRGREVVLPQGAVQVANSDDSVRLFTKPRKRTVWIERVEGSPELRDRGLSGRAKKLSNLDTIRLGNIEVSFRREGGKK